MSLPPLFSVCRMSHFRLVTVAASGTAYPGNLFSSGAPALQDASYIGYRFPTAPHTAYSTPDLSLFPPLFGSLSS